jgi:hypothetical protein
MLRVRANNCGWYMTVHVMVFDERCVVRIGRAGGAVPISLNEGVDLTEELLIGNKVGWMARCRVARYRHVVGENVAAGQCARLGSVLHDPSLEQGAAAINGNRYQADQHSESQ